MLEFWQDKFLCQNNSGLEVDDYNTTGHDAHVCSVSLNSEDGNISITMNGLPNHDFESGPVAVPPLRATSSRYPAPRRMTRKGDMIPPIAQRPLDPTSVLPTEAA